jgi:hypothetical protein
VPDVVVLVFNVANDVAENSPVLQARIYSAHPEKLVSKTYFHLDGNGGLARDGAVAQPRSVGAFPSRGAAAIFSACRPDLQLPSPPPQPLRRSFPRS